MADATKKAGAGKKTELQQKSPAEFFADNKNIAGFDNPGKCLYTTIRELVENALDSAESISNLPVIDITIEEVSKARLDRIRGLEHQERLDEQLYHDYETEEQRKKRLAKEQKAAAKKGDTTAATAGGDAAPASTAADKPAAAAPRSKGLLYYKVTVKDNGSGMPHEDIPDMLGRVLSGTKYGVKQTRGKFGLGAKMALIWAKMTTGLAFDIRSARPRSSTTSHYVLDIDIHKNAPNVHLCELLPNPDSWHGSELSLTIEGNWSTYRAKIIKYLRQIAVITPYAEFQFFYKADGDEKNNTRLVFRRRTDVMPAPPLTIKHHPSSVDLELVKRLAKGTKCSTMVQFLQKEFDCVNRELAERLVDEMRGGVKPDTSPHTLTSQQLVKLHEMLHLVRFAEPKGTHLSPAGEYNLRLGVMKELRPELIATHQGDVRVFEGHAFIVEAAVSIGGRDVKPGINVFRFANRIPLLFEAGSDVITRTATKRINWSAYKINQGSDKVGVFVSIVSTKIPFKGAGKEYIGDDVEEMVAAVKSALQACCLQLKAKIVRAKAAKEQKLRKRNLTKYVPTVCSALWEVLKAMNGRQAGPKRRRIETQHDLLSKVASGELKEADLNQHMMRHIERIDTDLALEFQVQQGLAGGAAKEDVWLAPATTSTALAMATGSTALQEGVAGKGTAMLQGLVRHSSEMHASCAVLRLLVGPGDEKWMPYEGTV